MDGPPSATEIPAPQVLRDAFTFQDTIINTSGQHASPLLTSNEKKIALKPVTGISVCSRCTTKAVASWPKNAPATQARSLHTLIILCLQSATAHLETCATGNATAWNISTRVKLPPMHTQFETLRSFASWTIIVIRYSVQKWVDTVRKCLRLAVVPLLRPWKHWSYEKIREPALASHAQCYVNPDRSTWEFNLRSLVKITKLKIEKLQQRRGRGDDPLPKNDAYTRFIDGIGSAVAKALKWNLNVMDWIAHPDNETHHDDPDGFLWVVGQYVKC